MLNELDDMTPDQLRSALLHFYLRDRFYRADLRAFRLKEGLPDLGLESDFTPRVNVQAEFPPIPTREYDYSAIDRNTYGGEKSDPIGRGKTPAEAESDLLAQIQEKLESK